METLLAAALAALIACVVMSGAFTGIQKQLPVPIPDAAGVPDATDAPPLFERARPELPAPDAEITTPEDEPLSDDSFMETRGFDKWLRVLMSMRTNKGHGQLEKLAELAEAFTHAGR
jgi:hypothetical protein